MRGWWEAPVLDPEPSSPELELPETEKQDGADTGDRYLYSFQGRGDRRVSLSLSFELKPKQEGVLEMLAANQQLSENQIKERFGRRCGRPFLADLQLRLNNDGYPVIDSRGLDSEQGNLYAFNYHAAQGDTKNV